jgi:spore coat protein U-like protein
VLLIACPMLQGRAEAAVSCTLAGPTLTFGTINIFATSTTSGNATLTCSGAGGGGATIYACLSIGTGSGGTTPSNRTLASGSNKLPIQITGGASWPSQIGNGTSYPMEGVVNFAVSGGPGGSGSYTFPIVITIPAPSPLPPAGTYSSSFTSTDFEVYWSTASRATCPILVSAGGTKTSSGTMSISATVANQCSVSASNMNFGTASLLTSALSATSNISVTCNAAIPLTIALDNGATGTGPTTRLMTAGTHTVQYGIYKDGAHSQPWGSTVGTNTASANGPSASLTAYGQVPTQAAPPPGSYADIVGVTVTY